MIIPVLDIMNNSCVSGKSGNREKYTNLKSIYGNNPIEIATNLKEAGAKLLYIADLDRIEKKGDNIDLINNINNIIPVLLDNGISSIEDIKYNENKCTYNIVATETLTNIHDAIEIFDKANSKKIIISVDIKNNRLLLKNNDISIDDIINLINKVKPEFIILLNISQVGTKEEKDNDIIKKIISKTPNTTHFIAGGITNKSIEKYQKKNINNFLIGTILHEGTLKYDL